MDSLYYNHCMPANLEIPYELDLGEFIVNMAHDLKSPFHRTIDFLKLVLKDMDGPIPDQAREDLNAVYLNCLHSMAIMIGLVEMARMERGERTATLAVCQADDLVQRVIVEWKAQLSNEFPVEVTSSISAAQVHADELLLRQCLANWMSFVLEFIHEAAKVEIRVDDSQYSYLFQVRSIGKKNPRPAECEQTIYGYLAQRLLVLNRGYLRQLVEDEQGVLVSFSLPKS